MRAILMLAGVTYRFQTRVLMLEAGSPPSTYFVVLSIHPYPSFSQRLPLFLRSHRCEFVIAVSFTLSQSDIPTLTLFVSHGPLIVVSFLESFFFHAFERVWELCL
jgi:hypothetical protein